MADKKISQLTTLSELSGDEQIPVAKDGANYKISAGNLMKGNVRYDAAQELTTPQQLQARANIDAMANTPSGDPMHYIYEEAGAVYDAATNKWSFSQTISGIGTFTVDNLSTEDVRYTYMNTYAQCRNTNMQSSCNYLDIQFAFSKTQQLGGFMGTLLNMSFAFSSCQFLKQFIGYNYFPEAALYAFRGCRALKSVFLNVPNLKQVTNMFQNCDVLSDFYLNRLNTSISLADSPLVSPASLAWTINKTEGASSTYSITLHHDAYVAAMADAAVIAALESHAGVTLIDAGETETE